MKKSIIIPTVLLSIAVFFLLSFSGKEAAIDLSHYKITEKAYLYHVPTKKESQQVSLLSSTSFFNIFLGKTFIGFKESNVEKFEKVKSDLVATVKIVCEIISVKKDKDDKVVEGNPDKIKTVIDYWKFTKNASNKNPNWFLAEIISK